MFRAQIMYEKWECFAIPNQYPIKHHVTYIFLYFSSIEIYPRRPVAAVSFTSILCVSRQD